MTLKIISKKILKTGKQFPRIGLINYTNDLSQTARAQKGFQSSKSYWSVPINDIKDKKVIIITISEWNTLTNWNDWYHSKERSNINQIYKEIINKESFSILKKKLENDDLFLL